MTFDFTVYRKGGPTRIVITVDAASEELARLELERRLAGLGLTASELVDWTVGVVVVRVGRA